MLVTGAPGTGKTTLALSLAPTLGLPLVAKDTIKEALGEAFGGTSLEESRRLGSATYAVMYALAAEMPRAMLEANFDRGLAEEKLKALHPDPIEVFCHCEPALAMERYRARARHPVHPDSPSVLRELRARLERGQHALALGNSVLQVDTTDPVNVEAIAGWVRSQPSWQAADG